MLRLGKHELTRREIASYLGISPALINYYFAKGHTLLIAAVSKQANRWLSRMGEIAVAEHSAEELLDQLQGLIIGMYASDRHIIELHEQLWRDGQLSLALLSTLKAQLEEALAVAFDGAGRSLPRMFGYAIWGTCEAYARANQNASASTIIDSGKLLMGHLIFTQNCSDDGKDVRQDAEGDETTLLVSSMTATHNWASAGT